MSKVYYVESVNEDFLEPYKIEIGVFTSLEKARDAVKTYLDGADFCILDPIGNYNTTCVERIESPDRDMIYIREFELDKYQPDKWL